MEEVGEELAAFAEDAAEVLGDGEDELAVGHFVADGGGDPVAGRADAALVARGAEVADLAGEGEEAFVTAVGALEPGEAGGEIAAAEEGFDGGGGGRVERAAILEVPFFDLDDIVRCRDFVVRRNGDVSGGNRGVAADRIEAEGDAALRVAGEHDERGALDELELELGSTGVRAARCEGCVDVLEDDAFHSLQLEFLVGADLVEEPGGGGEGNQVVGLGAGGQGVIDKT
jgi:hypothetical protein